MINLPADTQIYLAQSPVDMRKAISGLSAYIADILEDDPTSGHVFIFYNKSRHIIKALYWDKNGFMLWQKRLSKGRFKIPRAFPADRLILEKKELSWLFAGLDFQLLKGRPDLQFNDIY